MPSEVILSVRNLSKKRSSSVRASLAQGVVDILREVAVAAPGNALRKTEFWAVENVSFKLRRGESLAIVGANGAGKSTLLKMLFGLLKPDRGVVKISGKVQAILELGAGFHPLATAREAVDLTASLEGLSAAAAASYSDAVFAFAELEGERDTPVQNFSSGMKARLAFAMAANLDADLLLVDEVLAVGDLGFQIKCVQYINEFLSRGGALIFVSHSSYQVQSVCRRGIMLANGRVVHQGTAIETLNHMFETRVTGGRAPQQDDPLDPRLQITGVTAEAASGGEIYSGSAVRLQIHFEAAEPMSLQWGFGIWTPDFSVCVCGDFNERAVRVAAGQGALSCILPAVALSGGHFAIRAGLIDAATGFPRALWGYTSGGTPLLVKEVPGRRALSKLQANQLFDVEASWEQ